MTLYIAAGAVLAFSALLLVLLPLFRPVSDHAAQTARPVSPNASHRGSVATTEFGQVGSAIDILREIEFDRATGKLSDADYSELKATYTGPALAELRRRDAGDVGAGGGPSARTQTVTSTVGATVCPTCGPRPEDDAQYCSSCARYLPGQCAACGASVTEPAARYCSGCGQRLAA